MARPSPCPAPRHPRALTPGLPHVVAPTQLVVRVSLWMVAMQTVLDAYYCLFHLTTGVIFGKHAVSARLPTPPRPHLTGL